MREIIVLHNLFLHWYHSLKKWLVGMKTSQSNPAAQSPPEEIPPAVKKETAIPCAEAVQKSEPSSTIPSVAETVAASGSTTECGDKSTPAEITEEGVAAEPRMIQEEPAAAVDSSSIKFKTRTDTRLETGPSAASEAVEEERRSPSQREEGRSHAIKQPVVISSEDKLWGTGASQFWTQLGEKCKQYKRKPEEIQRLVVDLRKCPEQTVQSWLKPVEVPGDSDFWIIGDLHGDLLSFLALTKFAEKKSSEDGRKPGWCFLGDLFDDGPYGHAVLFEVLRVVIGEGGYLVVGNHDLSVKWDVKTNRFTADVSPHDFADWLNDPGTEREWRDLAEAASQWFEKARRALVLPDGTLVAHGGCVHSDRLGLLDAPEGFRDPGVLEDLVWLRAHESSKRKTPNRTARGCQFGVEDFGDFLAKMSEAVGQPIQRVIRGHDHVLERWSSPPRYEGRLLTLNAMSWRQREATGPFVRRPVIARHRPNEFPEIFQLEIPDEVVERLYGEKTPTE